MGSLGDSVLEGVIGVLDAGLPSSPRFLLGSCLAIGLVLLVANVWFAAAETPHTSGARFALIACSFVFATMGVFLSALILRREQEHAVLAWSTLIVNVAALASAIAAAI